MRPRCRRSRHGSSPIGAPPTTVAHRWRRRRASRRSMRPRSRSTGGSPSWPARSIYYRDGGWLKVYRTRGRLRRRTAAARRRAGAWRRRRRDERRGNGRRRAASEAGLHGLDAVERPPLGVRSRRRGEGLRRRPAPPWRAFATGDARTLRAEANGGWSVEGRDGAIIAREAVVALGPWAVDVLRPLGYRLPLAVKRGYHMHYSAEGNATLTRPVLDEERGYVITPMESGIRLTTGSEFARPRRAEDAGAARHRREGRAASSSRSTAGARRSRGWVRGRACPTCCR